MLQIATGQLFTRPVNHKNLLRGIIYTNTILAGEDAVETTAGRLLPSSSYSIRPSALIYELTENIEAEEHGPGVLVSSGVHPYLQDYSVVLSFALNCVCTSDVDLARRLTTGQPGLATRIAPQRLIHRFFDGDIWCKPDELEFLKIFVEKLMGLPRCTFLGVMRALRTYVNGMHRVADDLELAYTLLVASVESLAQDFDGHKSDWDSLDERKRKAIDEALIGVDEVIAQRVRDALLSVEHIALARRFRDFAIMHIPSAYFRQTSDAPDKLLLGKSDLPEVLRNAYQSRSKYVHQLLRLPDIVTLGRGHHETAMDGRATHLTLQGLSRLMRSVIIEFVMQQPNVQHESYPYQLERSGVVQVRMAPQYWVGRSDGDITKIGRNKLEGFLQQLTSCLLKEPAAVLNDFRPVLAVACEFAPRIEKRLRLPYLALHRLFNMYMAEQNQAEMPLVVEDLIGRELSEPSSESLIVHAVVGEVVEWSLDVHRSSLDAYFSRRSKSNGLRFPRLFEAAISLELAERFRCADDMDECRKIFALAVENYPGHAGLLEAETNLSLTSPISWREIMLVAAKQPNQQSA